MTDFERTKRPEPARDEPNRSAWAYSGPGSTGPDPKINEVIGHAVRLGYRVIGDNIQQGRAAASRISRGDYRVQDMPDDLGQLATRLVDLGRELSDTAFDVMGAILRDPNLRAGLGRGPQADSGPKTSSAAAARSEPATGQKSKADLRLTYEFTGAARAVGEPTSLRQPDEMAMPVHTGLHSPTQNAPPLKTISFVPAQDGLGVVARIHIPDTQPPGVYSGAICDSKSHKVLGTMTVKVLS